MVRMDTVPFLMYRIGQMQEQGISPNFLMYIPDMGDEVTLQRVGIQGPQLQLLGHSV